MDGKDIDTRTCYGSITDNSTDEGKPLSEGVIQAAAVLPKFTARQIASMDALSVDEFLAHPPRGYKRRLDQAYKATVTAMDKTHARLMKVARVKPEKNPEDKNLFLEKNMKTRFGMGTGFMGLYKPQIPWHSTSVTSSGILNPILTHGMSHLDGPIIGVDAINGVPFRYDAWAPYRAGLTTSVNGMIAGLMGSGKSMCMKTLAVREISYGRNVIIEGDPKGEWARVAKAVGGQIISVGDGNYLNPLDTGVKPDSYTTEQWMTEEISLRVTALRGLVTAIRPSVPLSMGEEALIDTLVRDLSNRFDQPTITNLVELLDSTWPNTTQIKGLEGDDLKAAYQSLLLVFNRLVDGALKGSFEKPSTVTIDPAKPLIVFNTGSVDDNDEIKRATYTAAMSAAIDRICYTKDGIFRLVIAEEGWWLLSNPELVAGWDKRMRLSGELGVSNWLLVHELADLDAFANKGSGMRQMINGILTKSETMILYRQSSNSIETLKSLIPDITEEELDMIDQLRQGVGLWRIGSSLRQAVHPLMSQTAWDIFNTSAGRAG
ncbi:ATP-binding protein [Alloscardovia venturai]|uniref:ATP-binding protein n=1 Tax=Alloscardovia venturai TaxID=1769421 RepID=A0ABW2Y5U4_9BIFI